MDVWLVDAAARAEETSGHSALAGATLRSLVAWRATISIEGVVLDRDDRGRPVVRIPPGLHVSVAHSGRFVAVAASGRRVGIDLELLDRSEADDALAARVCTSAELAHLDSVPIQARRAALVRLWARKEAVVKAVGTGFALAPDRVDVSGEHTLVGTTRLWLRELPRVPDGYAVALAGEGSRARIRARLLAPADL